MKKYFFKYILFVLIFSFSIILYIYLFSCNYIADRFIIFYQDENKNNNVLMIELVKYYNILPLNHSYVYSFILTWEWVKTKSKIYKFDSYKDYFIKNWFINNIKNENNENTLIENYDIDLKTEDLNISFSLKNMNWDFLINNSLNRFTYENMWSTNIIINWKKYNANFVLNKARASNSIIYNIKENIKSKWIVSYFTDMKWNIFSIDITNVYKTNTNYISHAWFINKNNDILKKVVWKNVKIIKNTDDKIIYNITDDNNLDISLDKVKTFSSWTQESSFLKWIINNSKESFNIIWFSDMYDDYK